MYVLVEGNHVYTLNDELSTLQQYLNQERKISVKVSNDFKVSEKSEKCKYRMISCIDDLLKIAQELTPKEDEKKKKKQKKPEKIVVNVLHQDNYLTGLLYDLIKLGYKPAIHFSAGRISLLVMSFNNIQFKIKSQRLLDDSVDGEVCTSRAEVFERLEEEMNKFSNSVFKIDYKSYYNEQVVKVLNEYKTKPQVGLLEKCNKHELVEIDVRKAYTHAFTKIKKVSVFNEFDYFRPYNGEDIESDSIYIVKPRELSLMFPRSPSLCYGKYLKHFDDVKIVAFNDPSFVKPVNFKKIVDKLYKATISEDDDENVNLMKLIANVNIGMLEKNQNKKTKSFIYDTLEEARQKQQEYGGKISVVSKLMTVLARNPLDEDIDDEDDLIYKEISDPDSPNFYVLNISEEKELVSGFKYIKELLIQDHNFKMYKDYNTLRDNNINVYSIKTDAFTIKREDLQKAKELLAFGGIGKWRVDKYGDDIRLPYLDFTFEEIEEIPITVPTNERIHIEDEYNTEEICKAFEEHKRVMVRADLPGSGKSYACEHLAKMGHKVVFVCPTNKLVQKYDKIAGVEAVTINRFFNMAVDNESTIGKAFDHSCFDVVVFDEIYFSCSRKLAKIKHFVENNQDKIIIATGDTCQLEPISSLTNTRDWAEYADECINQIFPYEIYLKENKRLKTQEQRDKLKRIKRDIFNSKIPMMKTFKKYFKFTSDITNSLNNIALLNSTCKTVSNHIRKKLGKSKEYEVGEYLTCRTRTSVKHGVINVNFQYQIAEVYEDREEILLADNREEYLVPLELVRKNFLYSYCSTCHSFQGSSINEKMTIFDYQNYFISRNWMWVAVTRATDLDNVYFYTYDETMKESLIKDYFDKKCEGYKRQDRQAGREIVEEEYVTGDWFMSKTKVNPCCSNCGDVSVSFDRGVIRSNITAQRNDNSICHTVDNCILLCCTCNVTIK
jgi:thymidine kinase